MPQFLIQGEKTVFQQCSEDDGVRTDTGRRKLKGGLFKPPTGGVVEPFYFESDPAGQETGSGAEVHHTIFYY